MKGKLISMSLLLMVALITASGCATGLANIDTSRQVTYSLNPFTN